MVSCRWIRVSGALGSGKESEISSLEVAILAVDGWTLSVGNDFEVM